MPVSQTNLAGDLLIDLGRPGDGPLHERVKRALRSAIRSGRVEVGTALPPSRQLAGDLGCSRWAVTEAYGQLVAEGYLEARSGSATRVRWSGDRDGDAGRPRPAGCPRPVSISRRDCPTCVPSRAAGGPTPCAPR